MSYFWLGQAVSHLKQDMNVKLKEKMGRFSRCLYDTWRQEMRSTGKSFQMLDGHDDALILSLIYRGR